MNKHHKLTELLLKPNKSLEEATLLANLLTQAHNQYWTAIPNMYADNWCVTLRFNPIVWS